MPFTFASATIAIIAMSGLPPLAGFGGKWLLLSAMIEKGWYGPAVMTLLATFVGFLYMEHFVHAIFFGRCKAKHRNLTEAPLALLIPQYLLVAGILVMSFFPKLFIEPVSQAIDPQFASTLVWQGMSLEMIYGYWNPFPVMMFAVIVSAVLFGLFWLVRNAGWLRERADVYRFFTAVFSTLTPPVAVAFWSGLSSATTSLAQGARKVYTGNAQAYNLYILYYFIVVYVAGGRLWFTLIN